MLDFEELMYFNYMQEQENQEQYRKVNVDFGSNLERETATTAEEERTKYKNPRTYPHHYHRSP